VSFYFWHRKQTLMNRPDHFIAAKSLTSGSIIRDLKIQNYPTHCFSISGCSDLTIKNILLDNTAGNAPNGISGGLAAAHNTGMFQSFSVLECSRLISVAQWQMGLIFRQRAIWCFQARGC
jgi:hypothetical protein